MKLFVSLLTALNILSLSTSEFTSRSFEDEMRRMQRDAEDLTNDHVACAYRIEDAMPPQKKMVGKEYESAPGANQAYKVANEAGATAATCANGFAAGYPCENVDLLSMLDTGELSVDLPGASNLNDIWGWTDSDSGREFALVGLLGGTAFVEITDPVNPIYVGALQGEGSPSLWRDIKTYENYVVVVSESSGHGMQIFDLTELLTASPGTVFSRTAYFSNFGSCHNVFVNEDTGFAYAVGCNTCQGGLYMINLNNPTNPTFGGCYASDGYTHDVQCVIYDGPDDSYVGREICFASNEDTITIVDVTNKNNPVQLSRTGYSNAQYTHQGWLTEDHEYFIFNDELDELRGSPTTRTHVMNVIDLNNPTYEGFHVGRSAAIDHNNYVLGEFVYQANYRAGLNVLKIGNNLDNAEFSEAGYFDIFPSSNSNQFNGAWSTYPYYPSGSIVVSGIEQGLFVLKFTEGIPPEPTASPAPSSAPTACTGDIFKITINTDRWPEETGWVLVDDCTDLVVEERDEGFYQNDEKEYVEEFCVAVSDTGYTFTITDGFGDGICCSYGDGSYEVMLNGEVEASGGQFDDIESTTFGADNCDGPPPTCVDADLLVPYQGNFISCNTIVNAGGCSNALAPTHCPLGCDECDTYACLDSEAPLAVGNQVFNCGQLAAQDPGDIILYCTNFDLTTTCRDTCGFCAD